MVNVDGLSAMMSMMLSITVLTVVSLPLSEMKHITLHVKSEVMKDHRIVITLEPLSIDTGDLPENMKDEFNITIDTLEKHVVQAGEQMGGGPTTLAEQIDHTESPENSTTTTEANDDTNRTTTTMVPSPSGTAMGGAVPGSPGATIGVNEFLVSAPNIKCNEGLRPDANGKCRKAFQVSFGKSMSDSKDVSVDGLKSYVKKFWKNLIMT